MVCDYFDKYTFLCEMYDEDTDSMRELVLNFFPFDNSVQVVDPHKSKVMVARVHLPPLKMEMLQIGNIVNIFSKLLLIKDCAPATRRTMFKDFQSTFALIKPMPPSEHGKVITFIMKKGYRIARMKNAKISKEFAMDVYRHIKDNDMMPIIIDYITGGEVIGLELVGPDAVKSWRHHLGSTDPKDAAPGTLRALFAKNVLMNTAHGCDTLEDATRILEQFFGLENGVPRIPFRATFDRCTCCVILPHVMIDGNVGAILEQITASNFTISAMAMLSITVCNAKEFYEVYKGILPEYEAMAVHLAEGKGIVLEVKSSDPSRDVVCEFRKICGPKDPDVCRQLYPETIRAQYGKDIVHNAVHCTDLPEDGVFEVEFFFKLLGNN